MFREGYTAYTFGESLPRRAVPQQLLPRVARLPQEIVRFPQLTAAYLTLQWPQGT